MAALWVVIECCMQPASGVEAVSANTDKAGALMIPITGECFCGAIRYQIMGTLRDARSCHCSRCRKAFSAQASAYALVDPDEFRWLAGEEQLTTYTGDHGFGLRFCRNCGSTLCGMFEGRVHGVTLGCVDGDPEIEIGYHIFTASKASWEVLPEGIVAFEAGPDAIVEVVPWDEGWPAKFAAERNLLSGVLAPWLVGEIEHIGSTAVPGMPAKPVIDIMAPVRTLAASRPAIEASASAGYLYAPYKPDVMHWFCKPSPSHRTHHLHLVPLASRLWQERLVFRDVLRTDPALAREYAALKVQLATRFRFDREAYTDAKGSFVARVLAGKLEEHKA
jgi:GrpB-like predicted nucleotidyltransferase (UPF0157 family)